GFGEVEGDVDDGFEFDGLALFGGGVEFPLAQGVHGVGVELLVDASHKLDAVYRAIAADHGVENDFAFNAVSHQILRILGIDLLEGNGGGEVRRDHVRHVGVGAQFGKMHDPTAGGAVQ